MTIDHDDSSGSPSRSGLFYLIALSIVVVVYAYWPSNKKRFDQRRQSDPRRGGQAMAVERARPDHRLA